MNRSQEDAASFSILMPVFNAGEYLKPALRSAQSQLSDIDEIVIHDGGSTDGSVELLREIAHADPRVSVVVAKDLGQSDALNRALTRATNEWVVWLNADDLLLPGALEAVRSLIDTQADVDVVTGDHQILRANGDVVDLYNGRPITTNTVLRIGCASFSGSVVMKTSFLRELGGFEEHLNCTMDMSLQLRMARVQPKQVRSTTPIGALRFHDASKSANLWREFLTEATQLRIKYASSPREYASAAYGVVLQLASFAVFHIRLTKTYRKLRARVVPGGR